MSVRLCMKLALLNFNPFFILSQTSISFQAHSSTKEVKLKVVPLNKNLSDQVQSFVMVKYRD